MKLEITRQRNEANEVSIDMDIIIHETVGNPKKKYQLSGYINFQDYDGEIYISENGELEKELYDFCEEEGYDYHEMKDYIIDNASYMTTEVSQDPESLSQDIPYIRKEVYNTKPYYLREDRLVYAVEKYLHTSEPKIFETDEELAKWLRSRNVDENNELSDEYIINEAISIGEIKQVKRKDIGSPNTRNQFVVCRRGEEVGVVVQRVIFL